MMQRLDPTKPEDLAKLVATGLIWNATVPLEYKDMAMDALAEGRVEAPDNLPAGVMDQVNKMRNSMGFEPLTSGATPDGDEEPVPQEAPVPQGVEQPVVAEQPPVEEVVPDEGT